MVVMEFVTKQFGYEAAKYLQNIRTGGNNNRKGTRYEDFFAVARICNIGANCSPTDFMISSQDHAFVDDISIHQLSESYKTNYQAKNSSGVAADWSNDIEQRFRWQCEIDRNVHKCKLNRQVLLVSSVLKAESNRTSIPPDMKDFCDSEFFPYYSSINQLICNCESLRFDLERLCNTQDLSALDTAFRVLLSSWCATDARRSVEEILVDAKKTARPNIFVNVSAERIDIPQWLQAQCSKFAGVVINVEFSRFVVGFMGFEVSFDSGLKEPDSDELDKLITPFEFFNFLMKKTQEELVDETR